MKFVSQPAAFQNCIFLCRFQRVSFKLEVLDQRHSNSVRSLILRSPFKPKSKIHTRAQLRVPKSSKRFNVSFKRFTRQPNKTGIPKRQAQTLPALFSQTKRTKVSFMPTYCCLTCSFHFCHFGAKKLSKHFKRENPGK